MEDIEKLNEQFLHIQGLLSKKDFAAAIELLDSMFKEYSAIDWVEDNKITDAESEQMQMLHYVYKDFYAHHLITYIANYLRLWFLFWTKRQSTRIV